MLNLKVKIRQTYNENESNLLSREYYYFRFQNVIIMGSKGQHWGQNANTATTGLTTNKINNICVERYKRSLSTQPLLDNKNPTFTM